MALRRLNEPPHANGIENALRNAAARLSTIPEVAQAAAALAHSRERAEKEAGHNRDHDKQLYRQIDATGDALLTMPVVRKIITEELAYVPTAAEKALDRSPLSVPRGPVDRLAHPTQSVRAKLRAITSRDMDVAVIAVAAEVAEDNAHRDGDMAKAAVHLGRAVYGPRLTRPQTQAIDNLWRQAARLLADSPEFASAARQYAIEVDQETPIVAAYVSTVDIDQSTLRRLSANVPHNSDGTDPVSFAAKNALLSTGARLISTQEIVALNGRDAYWEEIDAIQASAGLPAQSHYLNAIGLRAIDLSPERSLVTSRALLVELHYDMGRSGGMEF